MSPRPTLWRGGQHRFPVAHRFLAAKPADPTLTGIVEADEAFVLLSYKGSRVWQRAERASPLPIRGSQSRKRGGRAMKRGLSHEQCRSGGRPVRDSSLRCLRLCRRHQGGAGTGPARTPCWSRWMYQLSACAAALGVSHEALNLSAGERVRGELHIQTVNSCMSGSRPSCADAAGSPPKPRQHLRWFHLTGIGLPNQRAQCRIGTR